MNQWIGPETLDVVYGSSLGVDRQRVLRNTYFAWLCRWYQPSWVLGVFGAGIQLLAGSPLIGLIVPGAFRLRFFGIEKYKNLAWAYCVFAVGFHVLHGADVVALAGWRCAFKRPSTDFLAFGGTGLVFVSMAAWAQATKRDASSMGKWLMVGAVVPMVAAVANIWLQLPALHLAISAMAVLVSVFIMYDLKQIIDGGETNYVTATLAFTWTCTTCSSLLQLLMAFAGGDRE